MSASETEERRSCLYGRLYFASVEREAVKGLSKKQLHQENEELRAENARLRQEVALLRQKMDLLIRRVFGR
jgi:cell division protein FtsB